MSQYSSGRRGFVLFGFGLASQEDLSAARSANAALEATATEAVARAANADVRCAQQGAEIAALTGAVPSALEQPRAQLRSALRTIAQYVGTLFRTIEY